MLTSDLITEAQTFLRPLIRRTPIEPSPGLSKILGPPISLKLESLQLTGSFKIRGALFRLSKLTAAQRRGGIVTCSAGNHGKAVAYAARHFDVRATICVPRSVDRAKLEGMLALGADVRVSDFDGYDETEEWSRALAAGQNRAFISAFDDYAIMAGNGGTLAREVLEDAPDAKTFILPVGGGGLAAGFASAVQPATIIGCQLAKSPALRLSLDAGRAITKLPAIDTVAGGVEGGIGALAFSVLQPFVTGVALVEEDEILQAVRWMLASHQYLIEPTAAVTVAACLAKKINVTEPAVVVISGRNVSAETIHRILCKS